MSFPPGRFFSPNANRKWNLCRTSVKLCDFYVWSDYGVDQARVPRHICAAETCQTIGILWYSHLCHSALIWKFGVEKNSSDPKRSHRFICTSPVVTGWYQCRGDPVVILIPEVAISGACSGRVEFRHPTDAATETMSMPLEKKTRRQSETFVVQVLSYISTSDFKRNDLHFKRVVF